MGIEVVQVEAWAAYPWLVHGFSTRPGGLSTVYGGLTLNLGWTKADDTATVVANRQELVDAVAGGSVCDLVTLRQVHGTGIRVIEVSDERQSIDGRALHEGDGLMTSVSGVLLGIQTADCVPVMIVDVTQRVVAVLHAGWRGTAAGMARLGVAQMKAEFRSREQDLVAAVGPSIGPCCYEVGEEVRVAFRNAFPFRAELFQDDRLDLWAANRRQLVDAGVAVGRITVMGECTACARTGSDERRYFSHRAEQGMTGRMMSVVGVRAEADRA